VDLDVELVENTKTITRLLKQSAARVLLDKPGIGPAAGQRSAKVIENALSAGFHLIVHRARPWPVGSRDLVTR